MARIHRETGISTGLLSNYKNGVDPSLTNAIAIADALNVSLDYLAGIVDDVPTSFSDPDQRTLNDCYESMNTKGRSALLQAAELMSGSPDTRVEKSEREDLRIPSEVA